MLWDAATGEPLATLERHNRSVGAVAFSPDNSTLVTASDDASVVVWDVPRGSIRAVLPGNGSAVISVAFSPDGSRIATGDDGGLSQVWDARDGRLLATFRGHAASGIEVAIAPDGRTLATAGQDGMLKLWDISKLTRPWTDLAHDACVNMLGMAQSRFTKAEIESDALLGSLWTNPDQDVCEGLRRQ